MLVNNTVKLFTPGPLNTSYAVRAAMCKDIGSRTPECDKLTKDIQSMLREVASCDSSFVPILLQGSGTFAVEAMIATLVPSQGHVLVVDNGLYGRRMAEICVAHNIPHTVLKLSEMEAIKGSDLETAFQNNEQITHLAIVHFETAMGVNNKLPTIQLVCERYSVMLLLDSMSAFGALPIDFGSETLAAVASSSNKCLHGVPGLGIIFVRVSEFEKCDTIRSVSLDIKTQYESLKLIGQWKFTPPLQVMLALRQAIIEYCSDGGQIGRISKYSEIESILIQGLAKFGIQPIIKAEFRAPIIITFSLPHYINFSSLYAYLLERNLVIYPSKISDCFRLGCIGELTIEDANDLVYTIGEFMEESGSHE
ncbi:MAG: 2-aminoethylphosphonate--pyruvate transaminase [Sphingobacteriales bacterium]|nr:MAG: 2-aminoethylphosphonate--pyruvate transaminase [Sphingobacteriales bacterium]